MTESATTWIFAAGMRRSGSAWQYHLANSALPQHESYSLGHVIWQDFDAYYEALDGKYKYVILKCHPFLPEFVDSAMRPFAENRALALYISRDMRDVAASLLGCKMTEDWNKVMANIPVIIQEYRKWHVVEDDMIDATYESFDPALFLYQLRSRLNFSLPISKIRKVIHKHSIGGHKNLLKRIPFSANGYNAEHLMWHNHIQDGRSERYKTDLTPQQIADVESIAGAWLKERGYK